jgi:hypothetical protein
MHPVHTEILAAAACKMGALEALITVAKDTTRSSTKFAVDALDQLLNQCTGAGGCSGFNGLVHQHVRSCTIPHTSHSPTHTDISARYWLKNCLGAENLIKDGFYDVGYAGPNLEALQSFPQLAQLLAAHVDKKREVIHVDLTRDAVLEKLCLMVAERISTLSPKHQIKLVAGLVALTMGGRVEGERTSDFGFKFRITDLKLAYKSNVLPLGAIDQGTFYHRALLFKTICDRVGLYPCTVQRGDYNRAWNVVDLRRMGPMASKAEVLARVAKASASGLPALAEQAALAGRVPSAGAGKRGAAAVAAAAAAAAAAAQADGTKDAGPPDTEMKEATLAAIHRFLREFDEEAGLQGTAAPAASGAHGSPDAAAGTAGPETHAAPLPATSAGTGDLYDAVVVDLLYEPGKLLAVGSNEAIAYQRMA